MVDHPEDPGGDLGGWLHDEAARLEAATPPISAEEAMGRPAPNLPHSRFRRHGGALPPLPGAERRFPALAAAAVAAVLIGSLAGFAFGRASAPEKTQTVASAGERDGAGTTMGAAPEVADSRTAIGVGTDDAYYGPTLTHVGTRTTADGVTIRAYSAEYPQYEALPADGVSPDEPGGTVAIPEKCDPSGVCSSAGSAGSGSSGSSAGSPPWSPPAVCSPTSELWVASSTDEAVGQTSSPAYELSDQLGSTSYAVFGQGEGAPYSVAAARVGDQVTSVRATWPDGFVDSAEAVGGWVYVGHKAEGEPTLEALAADGSVLESASASEGFQPAPECMPPPPSLPPAGEEQPEDPDAARDAVRAAIAAAFQDGSTTEVGDIVFTTATEGAALVTRSYGGQKGYTEFINLFFEDDKWQVGYGSCDRGAPDLPCAEPMPMPMPVEPTPGG